MKVLCLAGVAAVMLATVPSGVIAQNAAAPAPAKASAEVIAAMAQFKPIAQATLDLVKKGDMAAAKTKITELETAWDKNEKTLKAKYPAEWKLIDRAIDKALDTVRKPAQPDAQKCEARLLDVIAKIETPVVSKAK